MSSPERNRSRRKPADHIFELANLMIDEIAMNPDPDWLEIEHLASCALHVAERMTPEERDA